MEVKVYHRDFDKIVKVPFVPRKGDVLVIDEIEYEVNDVVIDTDEGYFFLNIQ